MGLYLTKIASFEALVHGGQHILFVNNVQKKQEQAMRRKGDFMLEVVRNTYPGVDLQPGDKVEWVYQKGCFRLYKHPYQMLLANPILLLNAPWMGLN